MFTHRPGAGTRGRLLTTYGPFHIYERLYPWRNGPTHTGVEIDYVPSSAEEIGGQPYLFVALMSTTWHISDLDTVFRHIRMWLWARRGALERTRERLAYYREYPEDVTSKDEIRTLEEQQERLSREYDVLRRALLDVEAQHPEIDLGPIESTTTNFRPGLLKFVTKADQPPDQEP